MSTPSWLRPPERDAPQVSLKECGPAIGQTMPLPAFAGGATSTGRWTGAGAVGAAGGGTAGALELAFEFLNAGQVGHILRGKELLVLVQDRIPRDGLVLLSAEDEADRRPVTRRAALRTAAGSSTLVSVR